MMAQATGQSPGALGAFHNSNQLLCWGFVACLIATFLAYWPGLSGPFLFDDYSNIIAVNDWRAGKQGLLMTLLPNGASFVNSRPVSMASFVLSAWVGGGNPFSYKLGNLVVHLSCGALALIVLNKALAADPRLRPRAWPIAVFLCAVWMLHPLHASTVLYVVQRMAQLSALFTLLCIIVFLLGRGQLKRGQLRPALGLLFIVFPILLIAGILSKQNAAAAPFVCLVFEVAYFSRERAHHRVILSFFAVFVLLPTIAVVGLLALLPEAVLGGYQDWGFTLKQRLLTQPRAVLDYGQLTLLPDGPRMGIYTDDFPISTDLFSPPQTALALGVLMVVSILAVAARRRAPSFFAGWGMFMATHSIESSFLPLEMYYEHRNYLPSIGLLLAFAGLFAFLPRMSTRRLAQYALLGGCGILMALAFATFGRASVWKSEELLVSQAIVHHPHSMRAMLDQGVIHIRNEEYDAAIDTTAPLRSSADQRQRVVGYLQRLAVECMRGNHVDITGMERAVEEALPEVTVFELQMARLIVLATPTGECGSHSTRFLAEGLEEILAKSTAQTNPGSPKDATRMIVAQLYARAGEWHKAEDQAEMAWRDRTHLPAGALLVRIYVHNLKRDDALETIEQLAIRARPFDTVSQGQISELRTLVETRLGMNAHANGGMIGR